MLKSIDLEKSKKTVPRLDPDHLDQYLGARAGSSVRLTAPDMSPVHLGSGPRPGSSALLPGTPGPSGADEAAALGSGLNHPTGTTPPA